jgi:hypothetical protein
MQIEQLIEQIAGDAPPDPEAFLEIARGFGETVESLLDRLSLHLAARYHAESLNFETADRVANRIWGLLHNSKPISELVFPDITLEIYEAFDAGEYYHRDDPPGTDPEIKYTRPLIERALQKYSTDDSNRASAA